MLLARGEPTWWGSVQTWFVMNDWAQHLITLALAIVLVWWFYRWMDKTG